MKYLSVLITLFISSSAFSNQKGNGGDVVICPDGEGKKTIELLDFHEARIQRNILPKKIAAIPLDSSEAENFLRTLAQKLKGFDRKTFSTFEEDALKLLSAFRNPLSDAEIIFTSEELTDIPDSEEVLRGKNCESKQIVNQMIRRFPGDPIYIVQKELFNSLSDRDRLGLIIHESIYRSFIRSYAVQNSYVVRYLTAMFGNMGPEAVTFSDYILAVRSLGSVLLTTAEGLELSLTDLQISETGIVLANTGSGSVIAFHADGLYSPKLTEKFGGVLVRKLSSGISSSRILPWESDIESLLPFGSVTLKLSTSAPAQIRNSLRIKGTISLSLTEKRQEVTLRLKLNQNFTPVCELESKNGEIGSCVDSIPML